MFKKNKILGNYGMVRSVNSGGGRVVITLLDFQKEDYRVNGQTL